jgi:hypothetical protein
MAVVKKYADFFDDFTFSKHYLDRTSYSENSISRIRRKTPYNKDGWECKYMIECDPLGNQIGSRLFYKDIIKEYSAAYNLQRSDAYRDFSMRVSIAMKAMTNNPLIGKRIKEFSRETYVNLGKIIFEIKTENDTKYYFPLFTHNDKQHSSNIWLISKYNNAATIKFMTDEYNNVYRNLYLSYYTKREIIKNEFKLSPEDYMEKYVAVDFDSINQNIIITHNDDWREYIYKQIEKS